MLLFFISWLTQRVFTSYIKILECLTHRSHPPVLVLLVCLHQMGNGFRVKYQPRKPANQSGCSPTVRPRSHWRLLKQLSSKMERSMWIRVLFTWIWQIQGKLRTWRFNCITPWKSDCFFIHTIYFISSKTIWEALALYRFQEWRNTFYILILFHTLVKASVWRLP